MDLADDEVVTNWNQQQGHINAFSGVLTTWLQYSTTQYIKHKYHRDLLRQRAVPASGVGLLINLLAAVPPPMMPLSLSLPSNWETNILFILSIGFTTITAFNCLLCNMFNRRWVLANFLKKVTTNSTERCQYKAKQKNNLQTVMLDKKRRPLPSGHPHVMLRWRWARWALSCWGHIIIPYCIVLYCIVLSRIILLRAYYYPAESQIESPPDIQDACCSNATNRSCD